jgi:hypothetical protein
MSSVPEGLAPNNSSKPTQVLGGTACSLATKPEKSPKLESNASRTKPAASFRSLMRLPSNGHSGEYSSTNQQSIWPLATIRINSPVTLR